MFGVDGQVINLNLIIRPLFYVFTITLMYFYLEVDTNERNKYRDARIFRMFLLLTHSLFSRHSLPINWSGVVGWQTVK